MTQILQLNISDLETVVRKMVSETLTEARNLPLPEPKPDNLTIDQAVEFLNQQGYPVKKSQLYKESHLNNVPKQYIGKRLLFSRKQLSEWLNGRITQKISTDIVVSNHLASIAQNKNR